MKSSTTRNLAKTGLQLIALLFIGVFLLVLSACAEVPKEKIIYVTKEVKVPVREKCKIEAPPEPAWFTEKIDLHATTALEHSQSIMAELEQARAYLSLYRANAVKCE